jgi:hypothetical protein
MDKENAVCVCVYAMKYYSAIKNDEINVVCKKMDET